MAKPPYIVLLYHKLDYKAIFLAIYFAEFVDTGEAKRSQKGIRKAHDSMKCSFKGGQKDEYIENQRII